jgi:hypothetical protein
VGASLAIFGSKDRAARLIEVPAAEKLPALIVFIV